MTRASEWAERVAAWRASGLTALEYCAGRDYTGQSLKWWASKLRRRGEQAQRTPSVLVPVKMARVVRVPSAAGTIVVQVGGARVEVSNGSERATLAMVFEALGVGATAGAR